MASPLSYEGISLRGIRDLAVRGWAAGIVLACVLMIPAPPTAQLGARGWLAAGAVQALSAIGLALFVRHKERVGFGVLLLITWALPIDLAIMQWLGGGWAAPYPELLLLALILGSAGLPPRRFAAFAAGVCGIALLPAVYAPDRDALLGVVTELCVWLFVATALAMRRAIRHLRRWPYVAFILVYAAGFVVAFASIANFGILARERVQLLPFFLVLLAMPGARRGPPTRPAPVQQRRADADRQLARA